MLVTRSSPRGEERVTSQRTSTKESQIQQVGCYRSCSHIINQLFKREKAIPHIISILSSHKMCQAIRDNQQLRVDMKNRVGCGAPEFDISISVLEGNLEEGFTM